MKMIGVQYPITEKISWAKDVFFRFGAKILGDEGLRPLLDRYRAATFETVSYKQ